ncbi:Isopentenyldiphosphate isomerase [Malonomonas rubra DSM 5091]|uniref:Isopentenyldiphosphate isomerase n=1 Tax=Malonomonas rubra DSM 5091 TaxID=1122189 RepID=A0A1M6BFU6_MALRU|nr:NUDIX domain-containing protein [Malonomonas rubra]SHI47468.1 Isopentenyldiphosphate isomerase [Malonomonas rubra DSM 5091]
MSSQELVDLVNDDDQIVGRAIRSDCHGNPDLIHRSVHVLLFNSKLQLLLQKRSASKDIQPGKWDSSVGGHLELGEDYLTAAKREMHEELGVTGIALTGLYASKIRNEIESENIYTYLAIYDGEIEFAVDEIDEVRFWCADEIELALGHGCFTPNFEEEWQMFSDWSRKYQADSGERALCAGDSFPDLFRSLRGTDEA